MMDKIELPLSVAIQVHGETVSILSVKRATAKEMRELPVGIGKKMGDLYEFAAACCDIPPSCMDQLAAPDLIALIEVVSGFLVGGTGATQ